MKSARFAELLRLIAQNDIEAVVVGLLAGVKNRDYSSWIAWCFVLPPLVFVLLLLPRYQGVRPRRPRLDEGEERGF